jgi:hypothetical protein
MVNVEVAPPTAVLTEPLRTLDSRGAPLLPASALEVGAILALPSSSCLFALKPPSCSAAVVPELEQDNPDHKQDQPRRQMHKPRF